MLQKGVFKKLNEHNWRAFIRKEMNASDTLSRFKIQTTKAIRDLKLLASKLPNEEHEKIFSYDEVKDLIHAILHGNTQGLHYYYKATDKSIFAGDVIEYDNNFDSRITHIAALLVREGIKICIDRYQSRIEQDSRLNQATIEKLNNAAETCDAIAFKLYSPSIESTSYKEKLTYLFIWDKITSVVSNSAENISGEDNRMLFRFIKNELGDLLDNWIDGKPFEINEIRIVKREFHNEPSVRNYGDIICDMVRRTNETIRSRLRLDYTKKIVKVTISDITGFTKGYGKAIGPVEEELTARYENGNYYVYKKRD